MFKILLGILFALITLSASVQANSKELRLVYEYYNSGRFETALEHINYLESQNQNHQGLIYYWKGLICARLQDYPCAVDNFQKSIQLNYLPKDLYYEYAQSLYVSEKLAEARNAFKESYKKGFKKGVSLYYLAYLTQLMGDKKKATKLYKSISKLPEEEKKDIEQASQMSIGDIYLSEAEKRPDAVSSVQNYVIPQYEKALSLNEDSNLAPIIKTKIRELQQKYELALFQLRNGRPTLIPPYFLRVSQDFSVDDNVIFAPQETTLSSSDTSSALSKTDVLGRYTFYYKNILGIAPELRMNYTRYFKREPLIYKNDNYLIAPAIRTNYEYTYNKKPAAVLFDYDYSYAARDVNAEEELVFNNRTSIFMLGNKFNYFDFGETILRLRHRVFTSYNPDADSKTISLVMEQLIPKTSGNIWIFMFSYDRTRVVDEIFDTDVMSLRVDHIFPRYKNWFTPSVGLALNTTDPVNDRSNRGREYQYNPNFKLTKVFSKRIRSNFHYDYFRNVSKDKNSFDFKRQIVGIDVEYFF